MPRDGVTWGKASVEQSNNYHGRRRPERGFDNIIANMKITPGGAAGSHHIIRTVIVIAVIALSPGVSPAGGQDEQLLSLWETGAAGGFVSLPHYTGSDQLYTLPLVLPYVLYRGDFFRADRSGFKGMFYTSDRLSLDISLSLGLPVQSSDNDAREGMPDIPWTGQVGPRLVVRLYSNDAGLDVLGRLPVRSVGDINGAQVGWTIAPDVVVRANNVLPWGMDCVVSAGLLYGSKGYHDLYYSVGEAYVTDERAFYRSGEGLNSYFATLNLGHAISRTVTLRLIMQWQGMGDSVVADSPLVRVRSNVSFAMWFVWRLWESERKQSRKLLLSDPEEDIGL